MNYLLITLRIIHIVAGIFWVGGALMMTFFISPAARATEEAGQKFLGHLMNNLKLSQRLAAAAGLSLLAGLWLFWIDSAGFTSPWMDSGAGRGFGIGAAFGIIGFIFGIMLGRKIKAMAQLAAQIQGKPTSEQISQMQTLGKQTSTYSIINVTALILSVMFMAIARYMVI